MRSAQESPAAAKPNQGFDLHVDAKLHFPGDPDAIAHHFCKNVSGGMIECLLFASEEPDARIVGVEVIVTAETWASFPPEEQMLARSEPPLPAYAAALKQRAAGRGTLALRRLLTLSHEYPRAAVHQAVTLALEYGLFDLDRLERLILRVIAKNYFRLAEQEEE